MAVPEPSIASARGRRILGEGGRGAAPERARELVEQDEGEPALGIGRPRVEIADGRARGDIEEAGGDRGVGAPVQPPGPVIVMGSRGDLGQAPFGEPEVGTPSHGPTSVLSVT